MKRFILLIILLLIYSIGLGLLVNLWIISIVLTIYSAIQIINDFKNLKKMNFSNVINLIDEKIMELKGDIAWNKQLLQNCDNLNRNQYQQTLHNYEKEIAEFIEAKKMIQEIAPIRHENIRQKVDVGLTKSTFKAG